MTQNDDEDDNAKGFDPFARLGLTDEQAARFRGASQRPRDISSLMLERALLDEYLASPSPLIGEDMRAGIRYALDDLRANIAMRPARDLHELCLKCGALLRPTPAAADNRNLPALAAAGIHADVLRLGLQSPHPDWLAKWLVH
jgi:hypothetical protein